MTDTVKLIPNNRTEWLKTHTLTPEQREKLIAQKLERATAQFKANAKTPVVAQQQWLGNASRRFTIKIQNEGGLGDEKHLLWCVKKPSVLKSIELTWTEMSQTVFFNTHS